MQARYRTDYPGEFVILESKWSGGKKIERREFIENPIINQHISGRAAVIGSDMDREYFKFKVLEGHRGGLLGSKKLQTYGTAKIAQEMRLDFAVDTNYTNIQPLLESRYTENNIVYTTARNCIKNPGEFYLIPQNPHLCTIALPIYLAAFDGHKEVYMLWVCLIYFFYCGIMVIFPTNSAKCFGQKNFFAISSTSGFLTVNINF